MMLTEGKSYIQNRYVVSVLTQVINTYCELSLKTQCGKHLQFQCYSFSYFVYEKVKNNAIEKMIPKI